MNKKRWRELQKELLKKKNVVAVGRGFRETAGVKTTEKAIVCSVSKKELFIHLKKEDLIPKEVEGEKTDVIETGEIKALKLRTDKWRPAPGGVSIGHESISAGTLGCLVQRDGVTYILSNNHVLADSNKASIGDSILQPGKADDGAWRDRIAILADFVPIGFEDAPSPPSGCKIGKAVVKMLNFSASAAKRGSRVQLINSQQDNLVDAAIALPIDDGNVENTVLGIGIPLGFAEGGLGMAIQKSGRTTGWTVGEILQVDVAVTVSYGEGRRAVFVDQFLAGSMSAGGDSGSAVLNMNRNVVGLLFAGSDKSTIINPIQYVIDLLNLEKRWLH